MYKKRILVNDEIFLSMIIDDKLKLEKQANDVITILNRVSGIIWKSKEIL